MLARRCWPSVALTVAGYVIQARAKPEAIGLTTETAALTVCLLGAACTAGYPELRSPAASRSPPSSPTSSRCTASSRSSGPDDISAGVKLLAASFIVLPLLPTQPIDPWGALVPRSLWLLVILIAALSLVGYVATRALGSGAWHCDHGPHGRPRVLDRRDAHLRASAAGRSTATTDDALAAGTFLAWGVSFARVVVLAAIVHAPLALQMLVPFGAMALVTAATSRSAAAPVPRRGCGRRRRRCPAQEPVQPAVRDQVRPAVRGRAAGDDDRAAALPVTAGPTWSRRSPAPATSTRSRSSMATLAQSGQASLGAAALSILIAVLSNTAREVRHERGPRRAAAAALGARC